MAFHSVWVDTQSCDLSCSMQTHQHSLLCGLVCLHAARLGADMLQDRYAALGLWVMGMLQDRVGYPYQRRQWLYLSYANASSTRISVCRLGFREAASRDARIDSACAIKFK